MSTKTYPIAHTDCQGLHDPHGHYRPCSGESIAGAGDEGDSDGGEWRAVPAGLWAKRVFACIVLAGAAVWAVCWMFGGVK